MPNLSSLRRILAGGFSILAASCAFILPLLFLFLLPFAAATIARADVTVNETTKFDGFGASGSFGSNGTGVMIVSGDKARIESTSKPTGKFMKKFAGEEGFKSAMIMRLDRKVMYAIDFRDKSYQELPFDYFKQSMESARQALAGAQAPPPAGESAKQEPPPLTCEPVKFEAKRTGENETIAGAQAGRMLITGTQNCQNTKTHQACNMVYTSDNWYATQLPAGAAELRAFMAKQAAAMGIDPAAARDLAQAAHGLISQNTEGLEAVAKELAKIEGYPVRTRMTIEKGGDCGMMEGEGANGEQNPAAAMKGAFKGLFSKKKSDSSSESTANPPSKGAPGLTKIFGTSTEVTSITTAGASGDAFEPPAGFKKKDPPKIEKPSKP